MDDTQFDEAGDVIFENLKTLPAANIVYVYLTIDAAQLLCGIKLYDDLQTALYIAMHKLADVNGEEFAIEMSESLREGYGQLFVGNELMAASVLKPYIGKNSAADNLLWNKYLRNLKERDSTYRSLVWHMVFDWVSDGSLDPDQLSSRHRPSYNRLMTFNLVDAA